MLTIGFTDLTLRGGIQHLGGRGGAEIEDSTSFHRFLRCSGFIIFVFSCPLLRFNQFLVSAVSAFQRFHHFCIAVVHFSVSTSYLFSGFCVAAVSSFLFFVVPFPGSARFAQ